MYGVHECKEVVGSQWWKREMKLKGTLRMVWHSFKKSSLTTKLSSLTAFGSISSLWGKEFDRQNISDFPSCSDFSLVNIFLRFFLCVWSWTLSQCQVKWISALYSSVSPGEWNPPFLRGLLNSGRGNAPNHCNGIVSLRHFLLHCLFGEWSAWIPVLQELLRVRNMKEEGKGQELVKVNDMTIFLSHHLSISYTIE